MLEEFGTKLKDNPNRFRCPKCNRTFAPDVIKYNLNFGIKNSKPIWGCYICWKKLFGKGFAEETNTLTPYRLLPSSPPWP